MSSVVQERDDGKQCWSQIMFDSGERVLISVAGKPTLNRCFGGRMWHELSLRFSLTKIQSGFLSHRYKNNCLPRCNSTGNRRSQEDHTNYRFCVGKLRWLSAPGEAYTKWLTEIWNLDVQAAKAPSIFLRDPNFQTRSREFCQNEFAALKGEYRRSGVPSIREIVHMILIGVTDRDDPFFIAVNHGGNESFVHTFVSANDGELPFVHPLEEQRVLNWVQQGIGAIQRHQANAANRTNFIKSAQNISTQIFKEISALMSNVSASCDLLVITAEKSALSRGESKRPMTQI